SRRQTSRWRCRHGDGTRRRLSAGTTATGYVLEHTGKLMLDAWSGGAYWSHIGAGGWHVDAVLQGTRYSGTATTQFASLNTTGTGFISSLEGGVPIMLPQLGRWLRPRTASADPVATGILR